MAASAKLVLMGLLSFLCLGLASSNRVLKESVMQTESAESQSKDGSSSAWAGVTVTGTGQASASGTGYGSALGAGTGSGSVGGIGIGIGTVSGIPVWIPGECGNQGIVYQPTVCVLSGCHVPDCNRAQITGVSEIDEEQAPVATNH